MIHNPVMFCVEVGSAWTTVLFFSDPTVFAGLVTLFLWATVLFANFAEAVAEGRGKAQADSLRRTRRESTAYVLQSDGTVLEIASAELHIGDICVVEAGQTIPGDGDVIDGIATVDESAITGESAPVIRESGGDRSAVTGGTTVLSDRVEVQITSKPGETFLDRMITLVEGASRQKTPNEVALDILLIGLTFVLLVAVATLQPMAIYSKAIQSVVVLVALFVARPRRRSACCARPSASRAWIALSSGRARPVRPSRGSRRRLFHVALGQDRHDHLRQPAWQAEFLPVQKVSEQEWPTPRQLSSLADETPEGRSIVGFAEQHYGLQPQLLPDVVLVQFSASTRMSGIDVGGRSIRKGADDSVRRWVSEHGGSIPMGRRSSSASPPRVARRSRSPTAPGF